LTYECDALTHLRQSPVAVVLRGERRDPGRGQPHDQGKCGGAAQQTHRYCFPFGSEGQPLCSSTKSVRIPRRTFNTTAAAFFSAIRSISF